MPRLLWLVLLPVVLVYVTSLGFPYVWDDHHLVEGLGGTSLPLAERLGRALGPFLEVYFRPLTLSTIALELGVGAAAPMLSKGISLGLFLVLIVGLMRWLRAERLSWRSVGLVGLVFGTLPLASETVLWTSARGDLLVALFAVLALRQTALCFPLPKIKSTLESADEKRGLLFMSLFVLGALLSKESGVAVAAAVVLRSSWPFFIGQVRSSARGLWFFLPVLLVACFLTLRWLVLPEVAPPELDPPRGLDRAMMVLSTLGTMLKSILWPYQPDAAIGISAPPGEGDTGPAFGFLGLLALIALSCGGRLHALHRVGLGAILVLVFLLPASNLVPIEIATLTADRYLLLPCIPLALVFGTVLDAALRGQDTGRLPQLLTVACFGLALIGGISTWSRTFDWQSDEHLYRAMYAEADSGNGYPALVLGVHLTHLGRCPEATPFLREAEQQLLAAGRLRSRRHALSALDACRGFGLQRRQEGPPAGRSSEQVVEPPPVEVLD